MKILNISLADNQVQRLYRSDAVPRIRQKGGQALDSAHTKGELLPISLFLFFSLFSYFLIAWTRHTPKVNSVFLFLFVINISDHMDSAHTKGELSLFL